MGPAPYTVATDRRCGLATRVCSWGTSSDHHPVVLLDRPIAAEATNSASTYTRAPGEVVDDHLVPAVRALNAFAVPPGSRILVHVHASTSHCSQVVPVESSVMRRRSW